MRISPSCRFILREWKNLGKTSWNADNVSSRESYLLNIQCYNWRKNIFPFTAVKLKSLIFDSFYPNVFITSLSSGGRFDATLFVFVKAQSLFSSLQCCYLNFFSIRYKLHKVLSLSPFVLVLRGKISLNWAALKKGQMNFYQKLFNWIIAYEKR